MSNNFLDNFSGTLFSPDKTFERLLEQKPMLHAIVIVIVVSMLNVFLYTDYAVFSNTGLIGVNLILSSISGLISWVFFAAFFDIVAGIFSQGGKFKNLLVLSAFSLLPWILLGPVELFKAADYGGTMVGVLLGIVLWIWVAGLQIFAIVKTYNLTLGKAVIFVLIPLYGWFVFFNWFVGFFATLGQLLR